MEKPASLRRLPLKRGLDLTILAMGLFTLALILVTGELYRRLTIDSQTQTLTRIIAVESEQITLALSEQARQLGMDVQRGHLLREALRSDDAEAVDAALPDHFHRYFVTAGVLSLQALLLLDEDLQTIAVARSDDMHPAVMPLCSNIRAEMSKRQGHARLQPLSISCIINGVAVQTETVPIGLKPSGYIVVVTDPAHNLASLENRLHKPISISTPSGWQLYRSDDWITDINPRTHVETQHQLNGSDGEPVLDISVQGNFVAFYENLVALQRWILGLAIFATLFTVLTARYVTGKLVLEPLKYLSAQLRRAGAGRRMLDRQHNAMAVHEFAELHELYSALQTMALTDPLTHLPNRLHFERMLDRLVEQSRTHDEQHVLCYLDLDNFKVVNDSCGHAAGDLLLQQLAGVFLEQTRSVDTVARIGGDEFALLFEHCSVSDATRIANQVRKAVGEFQFFWQGQCFHVGISIGLVPINANSGSATRVMSLADASCYVAKQQGRNRVHRYHENDANIERMNKGIQWAARLQQALEEDRFELLCQPVVACARRQSEVEFYEVLVYLNDEGTPVSSSHFMAAAERYNLTTDIDRWVLHHSLEWLKRNAGQDQRLRLSINIAGSSLADDAFLNYTVDQLDASGVDAERLAFEITETGSSSNLNRTIRFISTLKGMGCRFILDDFGAGMSSFTYLQNLSLDYIKIDGRFISKSMRSDDQRVLDAIAQVGKSLHIPTIAECVESELVFSRLRLLGVDYCQGFYISKPRPLDELMVQTGEQADVSD